MAWSFHCNMVSISGVLGHSTSGVVVWESGRFKSCTRICIWHRMTALTVDRGPDIHGNSRHHGTLVASVVFGQCVRLFRPLGVTWWFKTNLNLDLKYLDVRLWNSLNMLWRKVNKMKVLVSEEHDGQMALLGQARAGSFPSRLFSISM